MSEKFPETVKIWILIYQKAQQIRSWILRDREKEGAGGREKREREDQYKTRYTSVKTDRKILLSRSIIRSIIDFFISSVDAKGQWKNMF